MYTAIVLDAISADLLKWIQRATFNLEEHGWVFQTTKKDPLPHHMTVNMGDFDSEVNPIQILGCKAEMWFEEIVYDEELGVCAIPVALSLVTEGDQFGQSVLSTNPHPHVTVCLKPGSKPAFSNQMLAKQENVKRKKLDNRHKVTGRIKVCK